MLVRATAVATERSNAIGSVELEATPHGLSVGYLGVGTFHEGYAPGALTSGTRVLVPWAEVLEARVEGDQVFLAVEPARTPHHRMTLTSFSTGEAQHHRQASRQRTIVWIGAFGAALVTIVIAQLTVPRIAPSTGGAAAMLIGGIAALAILLVGLFADRVVGSVGLSGDAAREAFAADLSRYLPNLVRLPTRPAPAPKPFVLPDLTGLLPRTTAAIAITLTAGVLGVVLTARWLISSSRDENRRVVATGDVARERGPMLEPQAPIEDPSRAAPAPPPVESVQEPAPAASAAAPDPSAPAAQVGGRCSCARADSVLWRDPVPKLSVLVLERKLLTGPNRKRLTVDVAAVNNSDTDVRDLTMMIAFTEQEPPPSTAREAVSHRSVFFEGPLGPGQAIKWNVEARGEDIEVDAPIPGDIGPGGDGAAPLDRIADLLNANHRPVRLHGAMMLAYLGDPRAREAVLKLKEALREDESPYLERLLRALGDVRACELSLTGSGKSRDVEACVFNAGNEPRDGLGVRLRGLDAKPNRREPTAMPPKVVTEATWSLPGKLEPQTGVRTRATVKLPADAPEPAEFEIFADREDLLP